MRKGERTSEGAFRSMKWDSVSVRAHQHKSLHTSTEQHSYAHTLSYTQTQSLSHTQTGLGLYSLRIYIAGPTDTSVKVGFQSAAGERYELELPRVAGLCVRTNVRTSNVQVSYFTCVVLTCERAFVHFCLQARCLGANALVGVVGGEKVWKRTASEHNFFWRVHVR